MTTMSFYEARTHFSGLLDQVARGKRILITRHGQPAALLGPPPAAETKNVKDVVEEMLELWDREGPTLGGMGVRELIEKGRRCSRIGCSAHCSFSNEPVR